VLAALLCSLALAFAARGETHTQSSKHASSGGRPAAASGTHAQRVQAPQHSPANVGHPAASNTKVQHAQAPQHVVQSGGHPMGIPNQHWPHSEWPKRMKYWEIIADNLKKAGWSLGYVSAIHSNGRTIWIADAYRVTISSWNLSNELPLWLSKRSLR